MDDSVVILKGFSWIPNSQQKTIANFNFDKKHSEAKKNKFGVFPIIAPPPQLSGHITYSPPPNHGKYTIMGGGYIFIDPKFGCFYKCAHKMQGRET